MKDTSKKIDCWKRDYLVKTFSRTKRKDYENYVVNRIWNLLDNNEIKPVTQQTIRCDDGKYAFIDLFFPQVYIGVECNEYHHENKEQKKIDEERESKIIKILAEDVKGKNFEMYNIDVNQSIEKIDIQVKKAVLLITNRFEDEKKKGSLAIKWNSLDEEIQEIIDNGKLSINDFIFFPTIGKAYECFGKTGSKTQHAFINIKNDLDYSLWFPQLSIMEDGKPKTGAGGWTNQLSSNGKTIVESRGKPEEIKDNKKGRKLITFAKSRDVLGKNMYRFVGVFQMEDLIEGSSCATYKKIADEIDLTQFIR